jgi:hypothetical protein
VRVVAGGRTSRGGELRRAVLTLVGLVLLIDGGFIGIYYAAGVGRSSPSARLGFTLLWTLATLVVVLRGLARVRAERRRGRERSSR